MWRAAPVKAAKISRGELSQYRSKASLNGGGRPFTIACAIRLACSSVGEDFGWVRLIEAPPRIIAMIAGSWSRSFQSWRYPLTKSAPLASDRLHKAVSNVALAPDDGPHRGGRRVKGKTTPRRKGRDRRCQKSCLSLDDRQLSNFVGVGSDFLAATPMRGFDQNQTKLRKQRFLG